MLEVSKQEQLIARLFKDTMIIFALSMLASTLGHTIDGIITGKFLGTESIAALGLASPYKNFAVIFSFVTASGMQILCSKTLGAGNLQKTNEIFSLAVTAAVGVAIVLLVGTNLFADRIAEMLGATLERNLIHEATADYLRAHSLSLPAVALTSIFTPIMQFDNDRRRAVISVVVLAVCNIAGDLINVFVLEGGLFGIGLARAFSYWAAAGYLYLHFAKPEANFKFTFTKFKSKILGEMLLNGSPVISGNVTLLLKTAILNRIALTLAAAPALAAHTIVMNFGDLTDLFPEAMGSSMQMISGILIGEKDRNSIRRLFRLALKYALLASLVITAVVIVGAPFIAELYTKNDPETYALTIDGIRWSVACMPLYAFTLIVQSFYLPYGRFRLVNALKIFSNFAFLVPAVFFAFGNPTMREFWMVFLFNQAAYTLAIFIVTCKFHGRLPVKLEDFLLLPDDFDVDENSRLDITVTNKAEVVDLSERVQIFCRSRGIDRRRSMFAGICIEEMAGNIVDYGFNDGEKHFVDVRVIVEDSQVTIRIRDDCRSFDPKKWAEIYNNDDPEAHIGIRLVSKIATEFDYVNVLKLNNLLIKL